MRSIPLAKSGLSKIKSHQIELKASDFEGLVKSLHPGEWCYFSSGTEKWIGFINPLIEDKFPCAHVVTKLESEHLRPEDIISSRLKAAFSLRQKVKGYESNSRIFYGSSDGLAGLIIDQFENAVLVQINTAGVDRYRDLIKREIQSLTERQVYFLDNPKYREKEGLPFFENESLPELKVIENGLEFKIRPEVLQKVGFYFDHRENRLQLINFLSRLNFPPAEGVDLFCYAGAWGISALKAGVKKVSFVDQGDFAVEVNNSMKLNGFQNRGEYIRNDVFKFLDESIKNIRKFDLVLCDPPAFAKSVNQKSQALEGYSKLHRKVFKLLSPGAMVAFSSCTHYVSHEEFQKNIQDASFKENRKIQLVYSGMQGFDHPVTSLYDRSNYIKSYFYIVE